MIWTLSLIVVVALLAFLAFYSYRRHCQTIFKKIGINGPEPNFLFGNLVEFAKKPMHECYREWTEKYGKVFGYYEASVPVLVTSDADILKEIFISQFSNFHGRKLYPVQPDPEHGKEVHMFLARGERWKRLRTSINPTFSSMKMKMMSPLVNKCVDDMMELLDEKHRSGKSFDIYGMFQGLTLDVIGECAFGIKMDSQRDSNDPFLLRCKKLFADIDVNQQPVLIVLAMLFPELNYIWSRAFTLMSKVREEPGIWLADRLGEVIDLRRKDPSLRRIDLVQLMLDAQDGENRYTRRLSSGSGSDGEVDLNMQLNGSSPSSSNGYANACAHADVNGNDTHMKKQKRGLTNEEIKFQSLLFLLAGFETTSTALAFMTHVLAFHPEEQAKLQDEIDASWDGTSPLTYDVVHKMSYLDMFLSEVLRLYPVAQAVVTRICMSDCTIKGIHIPKGMVVQADSWSIHNSHEYWPQWDPKEFHPERFSAENKASRHPLAWLTFGAGPRNCVGMRFALMEAKIAICPILKTYSIMQCEDTIEHLTLVEGATTTPKNGIIIKLQRRAVQEE